MESWGGKVKVGRERDSEHAIGVLVMSYQSWEVLFLLLSHNIRTMKVPFGTVFLGKAGLS